MSKFNIINEPWILALDRNGMVQQISLETALTNGKEYISLSGETKLQDIAILRLLVAVTVTILYRYDDNGNSRTIRNSREAIDVWKKAWQNGIPKKAVKAYFKVWENRFYLFDDEHPFFQVPVDRFLKTTIRDDKNPTGFRYDVECKSGTCAVNYFAAKSFIGTVMESGNKRSPFALYSKTDDIVLSYSEAIRWLVWYMNFSGCATKNPGNYQSKMTWASGGALLTPIGMDLEKTILLNSVMLKHGKDAPFSNVSPLWERETTLKCENAPYGENGFPDNIPELYTQQSRKIRLYENGGYVTGLFIVSGDYYGKTNAFIEPMFLWKKNQGKHGEPDFWTPKSHSSDVPIWKEFGAIMPPSSEVKPGCVNWIELMYSEGVLQEDMNIPFQVNDTVYGTMNSVLEQTVESEITINREFFKSESCAMMEDTITHISNISDVMYHFGRDIALCLGIDEKRYAPFADHVKKQYEDLIGNDVLKCLSGVIPVDLLHKQMFYCAEEVANRSIEALPISAYRGHNGNTIGMAERKFMSDLKKIRKEIE